MKNLKLVILAMVISGSAAYAQYDTTTNRQSDRSSSWGQSDTLMKNHPDGYYYKDGKTYAVKNGQKTEVDREVTLSDGTVITKDGSYTKRGGTSTKFKEGEYIDMDGNVATWKKDHNKDMNKSKDPSSSSSQDYSNPNNPR
jgi:hypothetical protein